MSDSVSTDSESDCGYVENGFDVCSFPSKIPCNSANETTRVLSEVLILEETE